MRNNLLTPSQVILDNRGRPLQYGYHVKPVLSGSYNAVNPFRLKEWDFYQISNSQYTLQVTFGHVSYAGAINACLFDYTGKMRYELTLPLLFPFKSLGLKSSAAIPAILQKRTKNYNIEIEVASGQRIIHIDTFSKKYGKSSVDMTLSYPEEEQGILVLTPFENKKHFYHNYKQSAMVARGDVNIGGQTFTFGEGSFGLIDWGRGRLPYRHEWWWGNGSMDLNGNRFGFNIGIFGDNRYATENALFYNGKTHKLDDITYRMTNGYKGDIIFTSSDKRFEMVFTPIFDNDTELNFLIAHNRCHQLFGYWNGVAVLDGGQTLEIKNMLAFVEFAKNRW